MLGLIEFLEKSSVLICGFLIWTQSDRVCLLKNQNHEHISLTPAKGIFNKENEIIKIMLFRWHFLDLPHIAYSLEAVSRSGRRPRFPCLQKDGAIGL
jgi:hypothetical protein